LVLVALPLALAALDKPGVGRFAAQSCAVQAAAADWAELRQHGVELELKQQATGFVH
jgi:hypothetical protein